MISGKLEPKENPPIAEGEECVVAVFFVRVQDGGFVRAIARYLPRLQLTAIVSSLR